MNLKFNRIQYPVPEKIFCFGGGAVMASFAMFSKNLAEVQIITSPRHLSELVGSKNKSTLLEFLEGNQISYDVAECTDDMEYLCDEVGETSFAFGFGQAWKLPARLIEKFNGRCFDYMSIPLPRYRGGAHLSWAIMVGERNWGCAIQEMNCDSEQGVFDSGRIIAEVGYKLPEASLPIELFKFCEKQDAAFLVNFLKDLFSEKPFSLKPVDGEGEFFLPRLNTLEQGWINWDWSASDICKFINAFSDPYAGASTLLFGERVFLKHASVIESVKLHPFVSGLVVTQNGGRLAVAVADGIVNIRTFVVESQMQQASTQDSLIGARLYTPLEYLSRSLVYVCDYRALGDFNSGGSS